MRFTYFDFARGILMSLGVVIHAAQVYSTDDWRVHSPVSSQYFNYIIDFIHSFRMPGFYLISGFFAMMLCQRYSREDFYLNRLVRLGVPLLFCGIVMNSVTHLLSYGNMSKGLSAFDIAYWCGGGWLGHLWFLSNLFIYLFVLVEVIRRFPALCGYLKSFNLGSGIYFVAVPLLIFILRRVSWRFPSPPYGDAWFLFTVGNLFYYAPFFYLGAYFFMNQDAFYSYLNKKLYVVFSIVAFILLRIVDINNGIYDYVEEISYYILVVSILSFMFYTFKKFFYTDGNMIRKLSDSSYTVYLVHPLILLFISHFLVDFPLNIYVQFIILVISVWSISFGFHFLFVDRIKLLRFLFNGRYR